MAIRRLPVYLLLDTSGSMRGEPIQSVNMGLKALVSSLRQDPHALESVFLSIISFDVEARVLLPLTAIDSLILPEISVPSSGPTFLGAALELLLGQLDNEVIRSTNSRKGDWRPLLFVMTDGSPSDLQKFRDCLPTVKAANFSTIVGCAAGPKAKINFLLELTDNVISMETMDSHSFGQFFKWVSASVSIGSTSAGVEKKTSLPPPPAEINIVY